MRLSPELRQIPSGCCYKYVQNSLVPFGKPFQVFEALFLVHVGMKRQWSTVQDNHQGIQSLDTVYTVGKHHGATRILEQEVIKVEVLILLLTVDSCLSQGLHSCLLPGQVNDFGFGLDPHFLHEKFQSAPLVQILLLLLQKAGGQAVNHGQSGREHKCLPCWIEMHGGQHLQQTLKLCKVASLYHSICFIDDQAPVHNTTKSKVAGKSRKTNKPLLVISITEISITHLTFLFHLRA